MTIFFLLFRVLNWFHATVTFKTACRSRVFVRRFLHLWIFILYNWSLRALRCLNLWSTALTLAYAHWATLAHWLWIWDWHALTLIFFLFQRFLSFQVRRWGWALLFFLFYYPRAASITKRLSELFFHDKILWSYSSYVVASCPLFLQKEVEECVHLHLS